MGFNKTLLGVLVVLSSAGISKAATTNVTWKSSLSLGASYRSGNVEKSVYTVNLKGSRYGPKVDWLGSMYGTYGKTEGFQTEGQFLGKSDYRYKILGHNKFYGGLYAEIFQDAIKDIQLRVKVGPNIGYYFVYRDAFKFDASAGTTFTYEKASKTTKTFGALRLTGSYDRKITDAASCYFNVEYSVSFEDSNDNDGSLVTGVKNKVNKNLSLNVEVRDQYDNVSGQSNVNRNDVIVTTGLVCDFG